MMDIEEEENWVMSRRNPRHGLDPLRKACAAIDNPQDKLKVIHVAGTNGKGSVCKAIHDVLCAHGYKVGLFTSPHLADHRDRMRISDVWISKEEFHAYLQKYMSLILENDLGMFEIDCLIAFSWFYDQKVDYAVIECGLGGRLDNTNIIKAPILSIITTIAKDHMNILGNRIEQIAFEKAGILHEGLPAVTGRLCFPAAVVVRNAAVRRHVPLHEVPAYRSAGRMKFVFDHDTYVIHTPAQYQKNNLSLALEACRMLDINIHDEKTHQALVCFEWQGRFEKIQEHPLVILDGAHNDEGMRALIASMKSLPRPLTIVYSALKDKPARKMAQAYKNNCDRLIVTHFDNPRADTLADLAIAGSETEEDWHEAVKKALASDPDGSVVITGSLYFISLVREQLKNPIG